MKLLKWKSRKRKLIHIDDMVEIVVGMKIYPKQELANRAVEAYNCALQDVVTVLEAMGGKVVPSHNCMDNLETKTMKTGDGTVIFNRCKLCGDILSERFVRK